MPELDPQLTCDSLLLGRFPLCHLLMLEDANYPWFILVPDRDDISEIYQLSVADQQQLIHESSLLAQVLAELFQADKMNVAALGNIVPQLHLHHVVRYRSDAAWPGPVWGAAPALPYSQPALNERIEKLRSVLGAQSDFCWAKTSD